MAQETPRDGSSSNKDGALELWNWLREESKRLAQSAPEGLAEDWEHILWMRATEALRGRSGLSAQEARTWAQKAMEDGARKMAHEPLPTADPKESASSEEMGGPEAWERKKTIEDMALAVSKLSPQEQLALSLHYEQELTLRDIALALNVGEGTAAKIKTKAISKIRFAMQGHWQ